MLEFKSKATFDQQKAYLDFQIFRKKKLYLSNLITFLILLVILVFVIVSKKDYVLMIATILLMIVNVISFYLLVRKMYKVNLHDKDFESSDELLVNVDYENIIVTNLRDNQKLKIAFDDIHFIADLKDYVFFYISDVQALCLDKKNLITGDLEEFINNLNEDKKRKKYKKYYK